MATELATTAPACAPTHVFERVLVGVDGSEASLEAARQGAVLVERYGELTLLGAYPPPMRIGFDALADVDAVHDRRTIETAVAAAEAAIGPHVAPATKVVRGYVWNTLVEEVERAGDTLVALGSHGRGRIEGIVGGSTPTELLHKAPCSVLVARPAGERFPERVLVGLDGSDESARAFAAAHRLAARFGSELRPVVVLGGKAVDAAEVARLTGGRFDELEGRPVAALVAASAAADLLVVGSRGLHGLRALGSVSERVAHAAHCSTLVVRGQGTAPVSNAMREGGRR